MKLHKRKLQLIAGSTYSISLPKNWIKDLKLNSKQEINLLEQSDRSILLSPSEIKETNSFIEICVDDYSEEIKQILYSLYYYDFEEIILFSKTKISSALKKEIRETIYDLSGAEIIYEDESKFKIKIMLKEINIDIFHVFYRMNLLISASIENIINSFDWKEIKFNEDEVDRLYNLSTKIITSSLTNRNVLFSSGIKKIKIIPSLFLIVKKLENISDNIKSLGGILRKDNFSLKQIKPILLEIDSHLKYLISYLRNSKEEKFFLFSKEKELKLKIKSMENIALSNLLGEILRYLINIQEEIIIVNFYKKLE